MYSGYQYSGIDTENPLEDYESKVVVAERDETSRNLSPFSISSFQLSPSYSSSSSSSSPASTTAGAKKRPFSQSPAILFSYFLLSGVLCFLYLYLLISALPASIMPAGTSMNIPFDSIDHPMPPSSYWGSVVKPYPTGAFWTNLVVDDNAGQVNSPIAVYPYGITCTANGVQVSYGATRRVVTQLAITDTFDVDLQLGAQEAVIDWSVQKYDNLSVTMG